MAAKQLKNVKLPPVFDGSKKRTILCQDALPYLMLHKRQFNSIITSMPDMSELRMNNKAEYENWFVVAAELTMQCAEPEGYVIFYQTDRRFKNQLISKDALLYEAASRHGFSTIWHKIVLTRAEGSVDFFRPTYSHMICFSQDGKAGHATADVIRPERPNWSNGMSIAAARMAVEFVIHMHGTKYAIFDPFCGRGTIPAIANALGAPSLGIDIDQACCDAAMTYEVNLHERH